VPLTYQEKLKKIEELEEELHQIKLAKRGRQTGVIPGMEVTPKGTRRLTEIEALPKKPLLAKIGGLPESALKVMAEAIA